MTHSVVYGAPPPALVPFDLASDLANAVQVSPLVPGSTGLETLGTASLDLAVLAAPPGTLERRMALAGALQALRPGGRLIALAPKDKGGARLRKEIEGFGCAVVETSKQHQRICEVARPEALSGIKAALDEGAARFVPGLDLWSQPGVFSWDRADPGSRLLVETLPPLTGDGADLGCGVGYLARAALASPKLKTISLIEIDRRAIDAARRNITDPRAQILWADVRTRPTPASGLDFVIANPPFHDNGREDQALGASFIQTASAMLRRGGSFWLVANRHLPYEMTLAGAFATVTSRADAHGFKVYEARR